MQGKHLPYCTVTAPIVVNFFKYIFSCYLSSPLNIYFQIKNILNQDGAIQVFLFTFIWATTGGARGLYSWLFLALHLEITVEELQWSYGMPGMD